MSAPSDWEWWAGEIGADCYYFGNASTRGEAIKAGLRETMPGEKFQIIEARSSTAQKYQDGSYDSVPFTHTRNHEIITNGPQP